jgi:glutathione synthase/RimK-type ligase-like ATP-grasp enzyme
LIDFGRFPEGYELEWTWERGAVTGFVRNNDWTLPLSDVTGVFARYLGLDGHAPFTDVPAGHEMTALAEGQSALVALLEALTCPVANRASVSMSNCSKPFQAGLVRACGLLTPPTLVTNDPDAVTRFFDDCGGQVIFKSLSGVRSTVRRLHEGDLQRLPLLRHGPAQFQQFLPGDNIRVHTIGSHFIATRIRSGAVDYRYARQQGSEAQLEPTELPDAVAAACIRLAARLGLLLSGIDLKETPDGAFYCFEVNPSPGFAYYEQHTGQPISAVLVEALNQPLPSRQKEVALLK